MCNLYTRIKNETDKELTPPGIFVEQSPPHRARALIL